MKKIIFKAISLATLGVFIACLALIMCVMQNYYTDLQKQDLMDFASTAAHEIEREGTDFFNHYNSNHIRVTWIRDNGEVIKDSQSTTSRMDNHIDRDEIREALAKGIAESTRYSNTLMEEQIYVAKRITDDSIVRVSQQQYTILSLILMMFQPILWVILIAFILAIVLAYELSKRIVQPLNKLDLENPENNPCYDELKPILNRIQSQQIKLKAIEAQLKQKQNEFDIATNQMPEGLLLMDHSGTILSMNQTAAQILSINALCTGKNILDVSSSPEIQTLMNSACAGESLEMTLEIQNTSYQFHASPVMQDEKVAGIVFLMIDVTDKVNNERMRKEFTANVSHELKTPLQTISGYAELLKTGLAKPEDRDGFYDKIYTESQRMITLVNDIIHLSHLDEDNNGFTLDDVDLYAIAEKSVQLRKDAAEKAQLTLNLSGSHCMIHGVPQLLETMICNLLDNAIQYNRPSGSVQVSLVKTPNEIQLSVADTGIGIDKKHWDRIFERFYRVDKSHSRAIGGTGLGLSIVKHAALIHDAQITLNSTLDVGTTLTLRFKR